MVSSNIRASQGYKKKSHSNRIPYFIPKHNTATLKYIEEFSIRFLCSCCLVQKPIDIISNQKKSMFYQQSRLRWKFRNHCFSAGFMSCKIVENTINKITMSDPNEWLLLFDLRSQSHHAYFTFLWILFYNDGENKH